MTDIDIVRAWKDEAYRRRLSAAERARLPPHPAGLVELVDEELDTAVAGEELRTQQVCSLIFACYTLPACLP